GGGLGMVSAQSNFKKGYVVMFAHDTINGYIDYRNWSKNPKEIQFKKEGEQQVRIFSPLNCKSFQVENEIYEGHIVDVENSPIDINHLSVTSKPAMIRDTVFLSVFLRGRANLYYLKDEIDKTHLLIQVGGDSVVELIHKKYYVVDSKDSLIQNQPVIDFSETVYPMGENNFYKGQLIAYLKEENLRSLIEKARYCDTDLIKIIRKYNNTIGTDKIYKKNYKIEIKPYICAGITNVSLVFEGINSSSYGSPSNINSENKPGINAGIGLELFFPRSEKKMSLVSELGYLKYNKTTQLTMLYHQHQISFSYQFLKSTNLLRYALTNTKLRPYIEGGIDFAYLLGEDITRLINPDSNDPVLRINEYFHYKGKLEFKAIAGIGLKYSCFNLELRKENWNCDTNLSYYKIKSHALSLVAGFAF
ncbi:MAG: hypothetical protein Q8862_12900, partial [Bacteroidota bacterium]|nr:hypothetical protein [Bacteroidota bacterium]